MPELDKHDSPLPTTTVKWRFPSVHPEGRKFAVGAAAITAFAFLLHLKLIAWLLVGLTIWVAAFFRDPIRTTPRGDRLIVAPADGLVTLITRVPPPRELAGPDMLEDGEFTRVSIFMSVFDVHINRAPIAGTVTRVKYHPGDFLPAWDEKASLQNEQNAVTVEGGGTAVEFKQIAGLIARRIVFNKREGDPVAAGERVGMIKFGSRVDVFVPASVQVRVKNGDRVQGGLSVLAERT